MAIRLDLQNNEVRGIHIRGGLHLLIGILNLRSVWSRHGRQIAIVIVIIVEHATIAAVRLNNVAIFVIVKSNEVAVAALNPPDLAVVWLTAIGSVRESAIVSLRIQPLLEIRPLAINSFCRAGDRKARPQKSAYAAIRSKQSIILVCANREIGNGCVE